jgi:hypothetical protein
MRKSILSALALASVSTLALMTNAHAAGLHPQAPHPVTLPPAPITTVVAGNGNGNGNGNHGGVNGNNNGSTSIFGSFGGQSYGSPFSIPQPVTTVVAGNGNGNGNGNFGGFNGNGNGSTTIFGQ